ncbi:hypothetical protein PYCC9005_006030 [Savitreella phatthalungensis]
MVKLALYMKASLEGLESVRPTVEGDEYLWSFTVSCSSCRSMHANPVTFSKAQQRPLTGSRGDAHLVWKCRECGRESSANVLDEAWPPHAYESNLSAEELEEADDSPKSGKGSTIGNGMRQPIGLFETRGCELVEFIIDKSGPWEALGIKKRGKQQTSFHDIDLSEHEWYDYDDARACEVSITELAFEIGRAK